MKMRFKKKRLFVEKSRNSSGYRFFDCAIIEGILTKSTDEIKITGPKNFLLIGFIINKKNWQEVSLEAGPARIPTSKETHGCCNEWRNAMIAQFGIK